MEFVECGDVGKYLEVHGTMDPSMSKEVTHQVLRGMEYVHEAGISHRDLKPDNILICQFDPIQIKISDFGLAKMVNNEETFLKTFCGTMLYLAPEVFPGYMSAMESEQPVKHTKRKRSLREDEGRPRNKQHTTRYNQACDMWSLGCVVYALLTGKPPFQGGSQEEVFKLVISGQFDVAPLKKYAGPEIDDARDFLQKLLQVRPEMRIMEKEALMHPWVYRPGSESSESMVENAIQVLGHAYEENYGQSESEGLAITPEPTKKESSDERLLRGSMAEMSVSQTGSDGATVSSYDFCKGNYYSLLNSRDLHHRKPTSPEIELGSTSTQGSSGVFPSTASFEGVVETPSKAERRRSHAEFNRYDFRTGTNECDTSDVQSSQEEIELGQHLKTNNHQSHECQSEAKSVAASLPGALGNLNVTTVPSTYDTPPPKSSTREDALQSFSFANEAIANFSPDSLKASPINATPIPSKMLLPPSRVQQLSFPSSNDDEYLPDSQDCNSQQLSRDTEWWGRLVPLPGSISHEPIDLISTEVSIGRASQSTIEIEDTRISKQHIAFQFNYADIATRSHPSDWRPHPDMIAFYLAKGRRIKINGEKVKPGKVGMLYDGDEIKLFEHETEYIGFTAELPIGQTQRRQQKSTTVDKKNQTRRSRAN